MNKLLFFIALTVMAQTLTGQVLQGNLWFKRQAQIDSFPLMYPGIKTVTGFLAVGDDDTTSNSDIRDLSPLLGLREVGTDFYVLNTRQLSSLQGLDSIRWVGYSLYIVRNNKLKDIEALQKVGYIGVSVYINRNDSLATLEGLRNVGSLSGDTDFSSVEISYNPSLKKIGLHKLRGVNDLTIQRNKSLEDLDGLEQLKQGSIMAFAKMPRLKNMKGLSRLEKFQTLLILDCDSLSNLQGMFDSIQACPEGGTFEIFDCNRLLTLEGLENLDSLLVTNTNISGNARLQSLRGLHNARMCKGRIHLENNPQLMSIDCNQLRNCGSIEITNCPSLPNLNGLDSLRTGSVQCINNPNLRSVSGLYNLEQAGTLLFQDNNIDSIHGFNKLKEFYEFKIQNDSSISSVVGLEAVDSTRGTFECYGWTHFPKLQKVEILNNARYIGSTLIGGDTLDDTNQRVVFHIGEKVRNAYFFSLTSKNNQCDMNCLPICDSILYEFPVNFNLVGVYEMKSSSTSGTSFSKLKKLGKVILATHFYPTQFVNFEDIWGIALGFQDLDSLPPGFAASCKRIGTPTTSSFNEETVYMSGLKNIPGFQQTNYFRGTMRLIMNPALEDASGICRLLALPPFSRTVEIHDNALPFDTRVGLNQWCQTLSTEEEIQDTTHLGHIAAYPNPVRDALTVDWSAWPHGVAGIRVYDVLGHLLYEQKVGGASAHQISMELWPKGLYQVVLYAGDGSVVTKGVVRE